MATSAEIFPVTGRIERRNGPLSTTCEGADMTNVARMGDRRTMILNGSVAGLRKVFEVFAGDRRGSRPHSLGILITAQNAFVLAAVNYRGLVERGAIADQKERAELARSLQAFARRLNESMHELASMPEQYSERMEEAFQRLADIITGVETILNCC